ncbi:winged helix-turn-helix transcriptional regulator [Haloarchaeobius sp. TZWSO28]|uniref:winged helix-turn-helix transcriptional regulator n=1 Tax=Haloarchaeobius sp. TZWSO28 TaxID=3446119 RepID=UPI003EB75BDD
MATSSNDNPNAAACPVIDSLEQIGSQWRLVVLHDLQDGEKRFNELKRSTDASSRTLSRVLDDLQEMGFVDRRLEEDAPVATFYSLTEKGESLCPVFDAIGEWADEWITTTDSDDVEEAAPEKLETDGGNPADAE